MARGGKRPGAGRKPGNLSVFTGTLMEGIARAPEMTAEHVRVSLTNIAKSDLGRLFTAKGKLKHLRNIAPEDRACIAAIKVTKKNLTAGDGKQEDVIEVKLWDKLRALELLGKYHQLFVERHQLDVNVTLSDAITATVHRPPVITVPLITASDTPPDDAE